MVLKTLSKLFQIIVAEAAGSLRMNQPGMLGKSRRRIYYNVKARRPNLPTVVVPTTVLPRGAFRGNWRRMAWTAS